jgi:hypothetical protein
VVDDDVEVDPNDYIVDKDYDGPVLEDIDEMDDEWIYELMQYLK